MNISPIGPKRGINGAENTYLSQCRKYFCVEIGANLHNANIVIPFFLLLILCIFNDDFGSFSVILAAILDIRHQDGHKIIKYLQNRLPWPQKHIYRHQHHYSTVLRTEVMRKLEFWYCAAAILAAILDSVKAKTVATQPKFHLRTNIYHKMMLNRHCKDLRPSHQARNRLSSFNYVVFLIKNHVVHGV